MLDTYGSAQYFDVAVRLLTLSRLLDQERSVGTASWEVNMATERNGASAEGQELKEDLPGDLKTGEAGPPPDQQEVLAACAEAAGKGPALLDEQRELRGLEETLSTAPAACASEVPDRLSATIEHEAAPVHAATHTGHGDRYCLRRFHARGGMGRCG